MPWCEECAKYMAPSAMNADGTCPTCGRDIEAGAVRTQEIVDDEAAPWHFKLLVVALVLYLGWRVVDIFL
ncbi:MAG: hypothetical protein WD225_00225 [Ilumatobacteraceae bacterium]